jgi:Ankyrin repeats (many copies)
LGTFSLVRNLTLKCGQPGYQVLQEFFSPTISTYCWQIVNLLLAHKADPNKQDYSGETALYTAVHIGNFQLVELLLRNGADANIQNKSGAYAFSCTDDLRIKNLLRPAHLSSSTGVDDLKHNRYSLYAERKVTAIDDSSLYNSCCVQ